ncbi:MAG: saccharopine dehydrogenase NADP-binding domain-containing protein [Ferruginibacter sp.]
MKANVLLYGANGYTGRLIAHLASAYNIQLLLAGRKEEEIKAMATEINLPYKIFALEEEALLLETLKDMTVVLHAAGPFSHTADAMVQACLKTNTHYLDINGDISVFEKIKKVDLAAKNAGIMLMPGVGFDVVPTDCLALHLQHNLPDMTHLQLAFATLGGGLSHGTAMTMASKIGEGGAIRSEGKIIKSALGAEGMVVPFYRGEGKSAKEMFVMNIPWGDVSTAHFTTGVPNIKTYTGISKKVYYLLKLQVAFNWLLRTSWVRNQLKKKIKSLPAGPSNEQRAKAIGMVWGKASNASGDTVTAALCGPEGYTITAHAALIIIKKVLSGNFKTGYQTPAAVYGETLITEVPGISFKKSTQSK